MLLMLDPDAAIEVVRYTTFWIKKEMNDGDH